MHGGMTSLLELLFDELERVGNAEQVIEERLRRGDTIPAFQHPLYPHGDPRAAALLPHLPADPLRDDLLRVMLETAGQMPTCDVALVALRRSLGLPRGSALALFAIARTAAGLPMRWNKGRMKSSFAPCALCGTGNFVSAAKKSSEARNKFHCRCVYRGMSDKRNPFDVLNQLATLRRYARSLVRNADDAEDLVHDALVRAYEKKSTFSQRRQPAQLASFHRS